MTTVHFFKHFNDLGLCCEDDRFYQVSTYQSLPVHVHVCFFPTVTVNILFIYVTEKLTNSNCCVMLSTIQYH